MQSPCTLYIYSKSVLVLLTNIHSLCLSYCAFMARFVVYLCVCILTRYISLPRDLIVLSLLFIR